MKKFSIPLLAMVMLVSIILAGCVGTPPLEGAAHPTEETAPPEPASAPEVIPTPMPEAKCPISCSADSESWSLVFECEEEGQMVTMKELEDRVTVWEDGELARIHAVIEYEFETSGNVYQAIIDIVPYEKSTTGYCITVEVTGQTLGNETVTCKNF